MDSKIVVFGGLGLLAVLAIAVVSSDTPKQEKKPKTEPKKVIL